MRFLLTLFLIFSIFISILIPFAVYGAPVFETDSKGVASSSGNFFFESEQSISNPLYFDENAFSTKISNSDVVVFDGSTLQEAYVTFLDSRATSTVYLSYTNNLIQNSTGGLQYFVNSFNKTQTVMLSENNKETSGGANTVCNVASQPKVAVTNTHVFVTWIDQKDNAPCNTVTEANRIAAIAIAKSSFSDISSTPFYSNSTTQPAYFDTGAATPLSYSMTANGTNAFIVWENSTSVNFIPFSGDSYVASTGGFGTDLKLGTSTSKNPDVVVQSISPYNIHVAWHDEGAGDTDVKTRTSSNVGVSFSSEIDVSKTNSVASKNVKLAESGGTVYVSWLEGPQTTQQLFVASSGNGYSPVAVSTNTGKSTTQQIIAAGSIVYTVWQDNIDGGPLDDILFSHSTNSGVTFGSPINLSQSSGNSLLPKISGNSTLANIVWRDNTFVPLSVASKLDGQVWFKSYNVTSTTLSGLQVISESTSSTTNTFFARDNSVSVTNPAPIPDISSSNAVTIAVWNPDPNRAASEFSLTNWEGSMKIAIPKKIDILFNSTEYLTLRNATITVVDPSASGSVSVDVLSPNGKLTRTLPQSSPGIFSNIFEIHNSTFGGTTGSIFRANYTASGTTVTSQAKIQDNRILDFLTPAGSAGVTLHDLGNIVGLKLTDSNSNINAGTIDTVNVKITSTVDTTGITLQLNETGTNTGIFEARSSLIFTNGAVTPSIGNILTITQTDTSSPDNGLIETVTRHVNSTSNPTGFNITLTETGLATNVYTAQLTICDFSDVACTSPKLGARNGDFIGFSSLGGTEVSNVMVVPDNVLSRGAIIVSCSSSNCGKVTATYNGLNVSINVGDTLSGGGGGGGISRAGLVVNALAAVSLSGGGGGGSDGSSPVNSLSMLINNPSFEAPNEIRNIVDNFDPAIPLTPIPSDKFKDFDFPLTINQNGYPLAGFSNTIETFSTSVGEPIALTSLYYEQTSLQHVSMYLNLRGIIKGDLSQSDTQILYNKDKPLKIIDPHGYFESVTVNIVEGKESIKKFAEFEIVFAKSMDKSDMVLRSWDDKLRSSDTIVYDAIEVSEVELVFDESVEAEYVEVTEKTDVSLPKVPEWIKNTVEYWSDGKMDDTAFAQGIKFLIQEKILDVPLESNVSISKDDELNENKINENELEEEPSIEIPKWIQNNAKWWVDGSLTEEDFLKGIKYLVEKEIIEI